MAERESLRVVEMEGPHGPIAPIASHHSVATEERTIGRLPAPGMAGR